MPRKAGPGRPKGLQNKTTFGAKAALGDVFKQLGGVDGMLRWAQDNPTEFYRIWAQKLIPNAPTDVNVTGDTQQTVVHRFILAPLEPAEKIIEQQPQTLDNEIINHDLDEANNV